MRSKVWIVFALACLCLLPGLSVAQDTPIGEWVPVSTSRGGLGGTRAYDTNGVVSVGFGAVLNLKYKLDDGKLSIMGENCPLPPQTFTIAGDTLTLTNPKSEKEQKLTRVKNSGGDGIVGKWTGDHYTGAKQVMHFTTNMNCYFSVPIISLTGYFSLDGNKLTEEFPKKGKTEWKWEVKDDVLTMTKTDGSKTEKYKRQK